jgi:hypothetical protein
MQHRNLWLRNFDQHCDAQKYKNPTSAWSLSVFLKVVEGLDIKDTSHGTIKYTGGMLSGKMHGEGSYVVLHGPDKGAKVSGLFHNGHLHGHGTWIGEGTEGTMYTGEWVEGKKSGKGTQVKTPPPLTACRTEK